MWSEQGAGRRPSGQPPPWRPATTTPWEWTVSFGPWPIPTGANCSDSLNAQSGQSLRQLCEGLHMTRQSVSKHLAVLEGANLVTTARRGRQKLHFLNPVPINEIAERWINHYERPRVDALADLKRKLEDH